MAVDRIAGADDDMPHTVGHRNAAKAAGKRLLVHMRMRKDAGGENGSILVQHLPLVGMMVPTFVRMGNRDIEAIGAARLRPHIHGLDIGLAGQGRQGGKRNKRGRQDRPHRRPAASTPPGASAPPFHEYRGHEYWGHEYWGHEYPGHVYRGNVYRGHEYLGHEYLGHEYLGHEYLGHEYLGHEYLGLDPLSASHPAKVP